MKRILSPAFFALSLVMIPCPEASAQSESVSQPTITFTKEFPGSYPAYYSISVGEKGAALYRLAPGEKPLEFQVSQESAEQIFALARKLDRFLGTPLESKRKVAQMGKKTLLFENGDERNQVSYNHTENPDAVALASLFERLSTTQQHADRITYLLRFDRLGIVKELLQVEMDLDQGRLLEPALLLPILEKVRSNNALVNVAHERAAGIIGKLQAVKN
ncbi:MAG: hypothetical protein HY651_02655 [Acidobacteria bacterium]|nr:hypothetical protein [Acidobacteriota bacterium]